LMEHIALPETNNTLLIEGAGGLMVPLTENNYVIDLAHQLDSEVILVCSAYLGCINHSLLSIDYLLKNDIPVKGLVFNGNFDKAVKAAIMGFAELPVIAELPRIAELTKESVGPMAKLVNKSLFEELVD
jgi:dethiobiotin synthetase